MVLVIVSRFYSTLMGRFQPLTSDDGMEGKVSRLQEKVFNETFS